MSVNLVEDNGGNSLKKGLIFVNTISEIISFAPSIFIVKILLCYSCESDIRFIYINYKNLKLFQANCHFF